MLQYEKVWQWIVVLNELVLVQGLFRGFSCTRVFMLPRTVVLSDAVPLLDIYYGVRIQWYCIHTGISLTCMADMHCRLAIFKHFASINFS